MKFNPITTEGFDDSWLINRLSKKSQSVKFTLIGSIWWINAISFLIKNSDQDVNKLYEKVQRKEFDKDVVNKILMSMLMAIDYLNTIQRIRDMDRKDDLLRISIITWYYSIYNAAQAMISSTDGIFPQTHATTADAWHNKFISRNLIPYPFNYAINSLVKNSYEEEISLYENYNGVKNEKPKDIENARGRCCAYLKGTAAWYSETRYSAKIKTLPEFKKLNRDDFKTKNARAIRDSFLSKKKISFLHLAYRYRGKSNYRDAPYISYSNSLSVNPLDFISDLSFVLEEFINFSFIYTMKRIGKEDFNNFINDVINNSNAFEKTKDFLKNKFLKS